MLSFSKGDRMWARGSAVVFSVKKKHKFNCLTLIPKVHQDRRHMSSKNLFVPVKWSYFSGPNIQLQQ